MEARATRFDNGMTVYGIFQHRSQCLHGQYSRSRLSYWRHHIGAQALDYFLTQIRRDMDILRTETFQIYTARIVLKVVTFGIVFIYEAVHSL
jgi:hypothetical protein